jgi:hypothetical protein
MTDTPHTDLPTHPTLEDNTGVPDWTPPARMTTAEARQLIASIVARRDANNAARLRKGRQKAGLPSQTPLGATLTTGTGKDMGADPGRLQGAKDA